MSQIDSNGGNSSGNASAQPVTATIEYIKSLVALRYPVLLVDRVLDWVPGKRIVASKCFTAGEPTFGTDNAELSAPPFPLLLEAMVQVAGLTVPKRAGKYVFLLGLDNIEVHLPPTTKLPQFGDQMITTATAIAVRSKIFIAHAESRVDGSLILAGDVRYIYLDAPAGAETVA